MGGHGPGKVRNKAGMAGGNEYCNPSNADGPPIGHQEAINWRMKLADSQEKWEEHMGKRDFRFSDERNRLIAKGVILALMLLIAAPSAYAQDNSGFSISPDGQITRWGPDGGSTSGPEGTGSWDNSGGYSVTPDGGYSTWQGQTALPPEEPISPDPEWGPDDPLLPP
jgi:hypothetical protein